MTKKLPPVDIIIVNYNGLAYIDNCLRSLADTEYPQFTVIVVDNGSSDGSLELIQRKYPAVKVIRNSTNLGFGQANAIGIRAAKSEFIALLNNDTTVDKNWLTPLAGALMDDERTAAVCAKLLFMSNPQIVNGVGGGMNFIGYGYDIGMNEIDSPLLNEKKDVFFPCAAACLLRRSAYQDIGGFDEKFFMYHEDVDLGWRLWLKGYLIRYIPGSTVYHAFGGTSLKMGSRVFRDTLGLRHALRSLLKNYEMGTLLRVLPVFLALGTRTTLKFRTLSFAKCILWNLRMLPDTLRQRRVIQKGRKVSDHEISRLIWPNIRLPVYRPDYQPLTMETFLASKNVRPAVDMSDNRGVNLGYGWYPVEPYFGDPSIKYRWSKESAVFYLGNPYGKAVITLDMLALSQVLNKQRKIAVSINNAEPSEITATTDSWETVEIPYVGEKGALEISLRVEETWVPDDIFHNKDERRLGVGLRKAEIKPAAYSFSGVDGVCVIIPTYNRVQTLLKTLKSLENQRLSPDRFEVIVVDDGSTDTTEFEVKAFISRTPLNLKYLKQKNKKQGAARNLGIRHATKPLLVFIGDDIITSAGFLEEHLNYHQKQNPSGNRVLIGYTQWSDEIRTTPFMNFIGEFGHQFGYALIKDEGPLPFNFFYTSNISILKKFLDQLDYIFEEDFTTYGWEDIELGYRLEKIGMKLFFNPNAVAYHHHAMDIPSFCRRQVRVGEASRTFLVKHPELNWFLGDTESLKKMAALKPLLPVLEKATDVADKTFSLSLPRSFYNFVLKMSYAKGATASRS